MLIVNYGHREQTFAAGWCGSGQCAKKRNSRVILRAIIDHWSLVILNSPDVPFFSH
jgi:hypothetical protein